MVNEIISFISNPITQTISTQLISTIIATIFLKKNSKIKEREKLKAGKFDEIIGELLKSGEMSYSELYRTNNFIEIAKKADIHHNKLIKTEKIENAKFDIDWFFRLYDAVGNVSNEQLQELWAKLIAHEFIRPVFSYRILELLKNLSYNEASQFEKICNYSILYSSKSLFIPSDKNFISENGIGIDSILLMDELGLIHDKQGLSLTGKKIHEEGVLFRNKNLFVTCKSELDSMPYAYIYPFTELGSELAFVVDKIIDDSSFLKYVKSLKNKYGNQNLSYRAYEIKKINEDGSYEEGNELEI